MTIVHFKSCALDIIIPNYDFWEKRIKEQNLQILRRRGEEYRKLNQHSKTEEEKKERRKLYPNLPPKSNMDQTHKTQIP